GAGARAQTPEQKCAALASLTPGQLPNQTTTITSVALKPPSAAITNARGPGRGSIPALPAHCELRGEMNARAGANGQHYAIKFHMRLPVEWNGNFFFEGGSGSNGTIGDALGNLQGQ